MPLRGKLTVLVMFRTLMNERWFVHRLIGQLFTYPLDVVRRRLQMHNAMDKIVSAVTNRPVPSFL
jgi:hypothetical protein